MMTRQTLQATKRRLKEGAPCSTDLLHALVDHGLEALDRIEGGDADLALQSQREREHQIRLALIDLREAIDGGDVHRALFTVDLVAEMLAAKGTKWRREWSWYQPRIAEEFDT